MPNFKLIIECSLLVTVGQDLHPSGGCASSGLVWSR